jgi:flagellar protein FliT
MHERQRGLLERYSSVSEAVSRMRTAARAGDWSAFDDAADACVTLIDGIEALGDPSAVLDGEGRRRRLEILRRILRDDAAIREATSPWLGVVDRYVGPPRRTRR